MGRQYAYDYTLAFPVLCHRPTVLPGIQEDQFGGGIYREYMYVHAAIYYMKRKGTVSSGGDFLRRHRQCKGGGTIAGRLIFSN